MCIFYVFFSYLQHKLKKKKRNPVTFSFVLSVCSRQVLNKILYRVDFYALPGEGFYMEEELFLPYVSPGFILSDRNVFWCVHVDGESTSRWITSPSFSILVKCWWIETLFLFFSQSKSEFQCFIHQCDYWGHTVISGSVFCPHKYMVDNMLSLWFICVRCDFQFSVGLHTSVVSWEPAVWIGRVIVN